MLGAGITAVPGFVKAFNSYRVSLKEQLGSVVVGIVESATEISAS